MASTDSFLRNYFTRTAQGASWLDATGLSSAAEEARRRREEELARQRAEQAAAERRRIQDEAFARQEALEASQRRIREAAEAKERRDREAAEAKARAEADDRSRALVQAAIELNNNYNPDDPEDPMSKSAYNKFFSKYGYEDYLTGLDEYNTRIERFNNQTEMAQRNAYKKDMESFREELETRKRVMKNPDLAYIDQSQWDQVEALSNKYGLAVRDAATVLDSANRKYKEGKGGWWEQVESQGMASVGQVEKEKYFNQLLEEQAQLAMERGISRGMTEDLNNMTDEERRWFDDPNYRNISYKDIKTAIEQANKVSMTPEQKDNAIKINLDRKAFFPNAARGVQDVSTKVSDFLFTAAGDTVSSGLQMVTGHAGDREYGGDSTLQTIDWGVSTIANLIPGAIASVTSDIPRFVTDLQTGTTLIKDADGEYKRRALDAEGYGAEIGYKALDFAMLAPLLKPLGVGAAIAQGAARGGVKQIAKNALWSGGEEMVFEGLQEPLQGEYQGRDVTVEGILQNMAAGLLGGGIMGAAGPAVGTGMANVKSKLAERAGNIEQKDVFDETGAPAATGTVQPLHLPRVPPPVDDIAKTIEEEAAARSEAPAPKIPKKAIQRGEDITPVKGTPAEKARNVINSHTIAIREGRFTPTEAGISEAQRKNLGITNKAINPSAKMLDILENPTDEQAVKIADAIKTGEIFKMDLSSLGSKKWVAEEDSAPIVHEREDKVDYGEPVVKAGFVSGGADGADTEWANAINEKAGKQVVDVVSATDTRVTRAEKDLEYQISDYMKRASKELGRYPKDKKVIALIRRNFLQVRNATHVVAIARGQVKNRTNIEGGTGWAINEAQHRGIPIRVFSQKDKTWYSYDYDKKKFVASPLEDTIDAGSIGQAALIGTRKITSDGKAAIKDYVSRLAIGVNDEVAPVKEEKAEKPAHKTVEDVNKRVRTMVKPKPPKPEGSTYIEPKEKGGVGVLLMKRKGNHYDMKGARELIDADKSDTLVPAFRTDGENLGNPFNWTKLDIKGEEAMEYVTELFTGAVRSVIDLINGTNDGLIGSKEHNAEVSWVLTKYIADYAEHYKGKLSDENIRAIAEQIIDIAINVTDGSLLGKTLVYPNDSNNTAEVNHAIALKEIIDNKNGLVNEGPAKAPTADKAKIDEINAIIEGVRAKEIEAAKKLKRKSDAKRKERARSLKVKNRNRLTRKAVGNQPVKKRQRVSRKDITVKKKKAAPKKSAPKETSRKSRDLRTANTFIKDFVDSIRKLDRSDEVQRADQEAIIAGKREVLAKVLAKRAYNAARNVIWVKAEGGQRTVDVDSAANVILTYWVYKIEKYATGKNPVPVEKMFDNKHLMKEAVLNGIVKSTLVDTEKSESNVTSFTRMQDALLDDDISDMNQTDDLMNLDKIESLMRSEEPSSAPEEGALTEREANEIDGFAADYEYKNDLAAVWEDAHDAAAETVAEEAATFDEDRRAFERFLDSDDPSNPVRGMDKEFKDVLIKLISVVFPKAMGKYTSEQLYQARLRYEVSLDPAVAGMGTIENASRTVKDGWTKVIHKFISLGDYALAEAVGIKGVYTDAEYKNAAIIIKNLLKYPPEQNRREAVVAFAKAMFDVSRIPEYVDIVDKGLEAVDPKKLQDLYEAGDWGTPERFAAILRKVAVNKIVIAEINGTLYGEKYSKNPNIIIENAIATMKKAIPEEKAPEVQGPKNTKRAADLKEKTVADVSRKARAKDVLEKLPPHGQRTYDINAIVEDEINYLLHEIPKETEGGSADNISTVTTELADEIDFGEDDWYYATADGKKVYFASDDLKQLFVSVAERVPGMRKLSRDSSYFLAKNDEELDLFWSIISSFNDEIAKRDKESIYHSYEEKYDKENEEVIKERFAVGDMPNTVDRNGDYTVKSVDSKGSNRSASMLNGKPLPSLSEIVFPEGRLALPAPETPDIKGELPAAKDEMKSTDYVIGRNGKRFTRADIASMNHNWNKKLSIIESQMVSILSKSGAKVIFVSDKDFRQLASGNERASAIEIKEWDTIIIRQKAVKGDIAKTLIAREGYHSSMRYMKATRPNTYKAIMDKTKAIFDNPDEDSLEYRIKQDVDKHIGNVSDDTRLEAYMGKALAMAAETQIWGTDDLASTAETFVDFLHRVPGFENYSMGDVASMSRDEFLQTLLASSFNRSGANINDLIYAANIDPYANLVSVRKLSQDPASFEQMLRKMNEKRFKLEPVRDMMNFIDKQVLRLDSKFVDRYKGIRFIEAAHDASLKEANREWKKQASKMELRNSRGLYNGRVLSLNYSLNNTQRIDNILGGVLRRVGALELIEYIRTHPGMREKLRNYMFAKYTLSIRDVRKGSIKFYMPGATTMKESYAIAEAEIERMLSTPEGKRIAEIADNVQVNLTKWSLATAFKSGQIDPKLYHDADRLNNKGYYHIPLRRKDEADMIAEGENSLVDYSQIKEQNVLHYMEGTTEPRNADDYIDPFSSLLESGFDATVKSTIGFFNRQMALELQAIGAGEVIEMSGNTQLSQELIKDAEGRGIKILEFYMYGKRYGISISQDVYNSLTITTKDARVNPVLKFFAGVLRATATGLNPQFFLAKNIIRDCISSVLMSKPGIFTLASAPRAIVSLLDPAVRGELAAKGVIGDEFNLGTYRINDAGKVLKENISLDPRNKNVAYESVAQAGEKIKYFVNSFENVTRIMNYHANLNYAKRHGYDNPEIFAAYQAQMLTANFYNAGTALKEYGQVVPYATASLSGAASFREAYMQSPVKVTMRLAALLGGYTLMMASVMMGDDDDPEKAAYKKLFYELPLSVREQYFLVPINGGFVSIPAPQSMYGFLKMITEPKGMYESNEERVTAMVALLANGMLGLNMSGNTKSELLLSALASYTPVSGVWKALYESVSKKKWDTGQELFTDDEKNQMEAGAAYLTTNKNVPQYLNDLAISLHTATGGEVNISPINMQIWMRNVFSGLGTQAAYGKDIIGDMFSIYWRGPETKGGLATAYYKTTVDISNQMEQMILDSSGDQALLGKFKSARAQADDISLYLMDDFRTIYNNDPTAVDELGNTFAERCINKIEPTIGDGVEDKILMLAYASTMGSGPYGTGLAEDWDASMFFATEDDLYNATEAVQRKYFQTLLNAGLKFNSPKAQARAILGLSDRYWAPQVNPEDKKNMMKELSADMNEVRDRMSDIQDVIDGGGTIDYAYDLILNQPGSPTSDEVRIIINLTQVDPNTGATITGFNPDLWYSEKDMTERFNATESVISSDEYNEHAVLYYDALYDACMEQGQPGYDDMASTKSVGYKRAQAHVFSELWIDDSAKGVPKLYQRMVKDNNEDSVSRTEWLEFLDSENPDDLALAVNLSLIDDALANVGASTKSGNHSEKKYWIKEGGSGGYGGYGGGGRSSHLSLSELRAAAKQFFPKGNSQSVSTTVNTKGAEATPRVIKGKNYSAGEKSKANYYIPTAKSMVKYKRSDKRQPNMDRSYMDYLKGSQTSQSHFKATRVYE